MADHPVPADDAASDGDRPRHTWTDYELAVMLALISRGKHRDTTFGGPHAAIAPFAARLNRALAGDAIDADDVRAMLLRVFQEKKGALALIERQPRPPGRLTRLQRLVFAKRLRYDGSVREWEVEGRKGYERGAMRESYRRWVERMGRLGLEGEGEGAAVQGQEKNRRERGKDRDGDTIKEDLPMTTYGKGALVRSLMREHEKPSSWDTDDEVHEQEVQISTQSSWQHGPGTAVASVTAHCGPSQYTYAATGYDNTSYNAEMPRASQPVTSNDQQHVPVPFNNGYAAAPPHTPYYPGLNYDGASPGVAGGWQTVYNTDPRSHRPEQYFAVTPAAMERDTPLSPLSTVSTPYHPRSPLPRELPSIDQVIGRQTPALSDWGASSQYRGSSPDYGYQMQQDMAGRTPVPGTGWAGGFRQYAESPCPDSMQAAGYGTPGFSTASPAGDHPYGAGMEGSPCHGNRGEPMVRQSRS